jgi:hypothetical protein
MYHTYLGSMKMKLLPAALLVLSSAVHAQGQQLQLTGGAGTCTAIGEDFQTDRQHSGRSYDAGLRLFSRRPVSAKAGITLTAGVDYAVNQYSYGPLYLETSFDPKTGFSTGKYIDLVYRFRFLRVPLTAGLDYRFSPRFSVGAAAGPMVTLLLDVRSLSSSPGRQDLEPDGSRLGIGATANLAFTWNPAKKIHIGLLPTFAMQGFSKDRRIYASRFRSFSARLMAGIDL